MHDVDYMIDETAWESIKSDAKAIWNSDFSLEGLVMKAGLTYRSVFLRNWMYGGDVAEGRALKKMVKLDPVYRATYTRLGLLDILDKW